MLWVENTVGYVYTCLLAPNTQINNAKHSLTIIILSHYPDSLPVVAKWKSSLTSQELLNT